MSEHLSQSQLAGYTGRTLDPHELLAVDGHLASCDDCHERLTGVAKPSPGPSIHSDEEPFHLDYDQHLEPYVDGTANDIDREIVESHVAECSQCADELNDLVAFKQQPAVPLTARTVVTSPRWKRWLPQWPLLSNPRLATAAVIAVLMLAIAVVLWITYRGPRPVQQTAGSSEKQRQDIAKEPSPSPQNSPANQTTLPREEPLITLNDAGGQILVNQRGQLEGLDDLPRDLKDNIERALATRRLRDSPALTGWPTGAGVLRSELEQQNTFAPLEPLDVVLETDRPQFHWQALEGASQYVVTIHDAKFREVGRSGPITGTEWTATNSLERGVIYSWQVSALKDGETIVSPKPPLREARFRILDQRDVVALATLKRTSGNSHLVMGVFYWRHGLIKEAQREFQTLAKANPNSTVVAELLASIRSQRR
ncbi:MAG TPA: zf-HC2 domain-containing protein [Pyrinomonadaceae bacterium]|nr:zf-HC2 domain-containing protein [Pyrinomonadaceae bacterium]